LIPNVVEFLSENWAMALYHEWFSEFRYLIMNEVLENENIKSIKETVAKHAREGKFLDHTFYYKIKASLT